jgi:hypothetical protein
VELGTGGKKKHDLIRGGAFWNELNVEPRSRFQHCGLRCLAEVGKGDIGRAVSVCLGYGIATIMLEAGN